MTHFDHAAKRTEAFPSAGIRASFLWLRGVILLITTRAPSASNTQRPLTSPLESAKDGLKFMQPFYPGKGQDAGVPELEIPPLTECLEAIEKLNKKRGKARERYLKFIAIRLKTTPQQLLDIAEAYDRRGDCHE